MPISAEWGQRHTGHPGNFPAGWPFLQKPEKSALLSALLVAAPFGRASAVLRGTVWSGSAARWESHNFCNHPLFVICCVFLP